MLAEHGRAGAAFRGVVANTVAAFALGDYEWILPIEADELTDLVDMMRELRAVDARLHVREEIPFYTGRRIDVDEIEEVLCDDQETVDRMKEIVAKISRRANTGWWSGAGGPPPPTTRSASRRTAPQPLSLAGGRSRSPARSSKT